MHARIRYPHPDAGAGKAGESMSRPATGNTSMSKGLRKGLTSYGDEAFSLFLRKAFIKAAGYSDDALNRPIIGVTNTFSDYNPCHGNVPDLIESVKRGVLLAGGVALSFSPPFV